MFGESMCSLAIRDRSPPVTCAKRLLVLKIVPCFLGGFRGHPVNI
jgi:hypothetical protein